MIFSKKVYKLVSGKNPTLYGTSEDKIEMFVFEKCVNKYSIDLNNFVKSTLETANLPYNMVQKIDETNSMVCYGENISIISNTDENL